MKCEMRYKKNKRGELVPRGLVLICETSEESDIIDECCGNQVGEDGLIFAGSYEIRLSDGFREHYVYLKAKAMEAAEVSGDRYVI